MSYNISPHTTVLLLCFSDLLCSGCQHLHSSTLLQMTLFHFLKIAVNMYCILFIHSSVDEHLGCFFVLAIVNGFTINMEVQISFLSIILAGYMPRCGITGHMIVLFFIDILFIFILIGLFQLEDNYFTIL